MCGGRAMRVNRGVTCARLFYAPVERWFSNPPPPPYARLFNNGEKGYGERACEVTHSAGSKLFRSRQRRINHT
jgi:hypothetical protein